MGVDWRAHAGCIGKRTAIFYPEDGDNQHTYEAAIETCMGCPVRLHCLAYALDRPETQGIWGGMTANERRRVRRKRRLA